LLAITKHQAQSTTHYFPTFDGNGNVSEYLTASGSIAAHYEYDPFGRTIVATGSQAADFAYRFSTKPVDPATGLYYYGYRWFDPETGRWINRDPIEERGGLNLYGFVGNSSLFNFDVVGLQGFPGVPPNLNTNGQVTDWALGNYKPHHPPMPPPAKFDDSWPEECPGGQMEVLVYDNFPLDIVIPALFGENSTNPFGKLALSCCCERLVGIALQINDDKDRNIMQNQLGIQRNAMFGMLALRNGGVHVRIGPDIITHKGIIFAGVLGRFSDLKIDANGNLLSSDGTLRPDLPFVDEDEKFRATLRDKLAEHKEELKKIVAAYPSVLRKIDEFTDACKNRGLKK
jgi:RHS repeat-associated protein